MDILERYVAAYTIECLTGIPGSNEAYYSVLAASKSNTKHPLLRQVLDITHGHEPRDAEIKQKVRTLALHYLATKFPDVALVNSTGSPPDRIE